MAARGLRVGFMELLVPVWWRAGARRGRTFPPHRCGVAAGRPVGVDLACIVIICCAADAQLARIHLRDHDGDATLRFADNTWLRVEGEVTPAVRQPHTAPIPTLRAVTVTPVNAPANQYA
jgi:hypothetical protein